MLLPMPPFYAFWCWYKCSTFMAYFNQYKAICTKEYEDKPDRFVFDYSSGQPVMPIFNSNLLPGAFLKCIMTEAKKDLHESTLKHFGKGFQKCVSIIPAAIASIITGMGRAVVK